MHKSFFFLIAISLSFLFYACSEMSPERKKVYDEVMTIHDEVMPEMKTINKLERKLKKITTEVQNQDSLVMINATLKRVSQAGQGMMDWMHELEVPSKSVPDQEAIKYLEQEREKIKLVSSKMKKAIRSGNAIVGSYKKK